MIKKLQSIIIILLMILTVACSEEDVLQNTTYSISNESTAILYNFASFSYPTDTLLNFQLYGVLMPTVITSIYNTTNTEIICGFSLSYETNAPLYFIANPFIIKQNKYNKFIINDTTSIITSKSKSIQFKLLIK